ncbi:MAG TPA: glycosyltransferase [Ruminiclostridium sp.]|nr:glycosyltransferase [Ruminiclostridium sp.]
MRIAVLGAAKSIHTIKWVKALAGNGHTVELYSLPDQKAPAGTLGDIKVNYLKTGGVAGYWLCAGELKKLLREFEPDVLNVHYASGYGTLARLCGIKPVLLSVWGSDVYDFPYQGYINKRMLIKNIESAAAVASTSKAMAEQVKRVHFTDKRIYITPFGVDTEVFRRCGEPPKDRITVGIVKALEPKYGVEYLIRAFSLFKNRIIKEDKVPADGIKLEIYGDGSLLHPLKALANELNISEEVQFHGAVPHAYVPRIMSSFDIFCAPSVEDSESFGVAAVEAMACEIPVVVSDVDGFKEVVRDRETGFIVTRRDPVTLSNKIYTLAVSEQLRYSMGQAGRSHVMNCYEWRDCVRKMENALTETAMAELIRKRSK